eukprot:scaffold10674_cov62-Phaeocystis_antarctica.AAC.2
MRLRSVTILCEQRLVVDLEREAAAEIVHVVLREVEPSVLGVVVGSLAHENGAVPAVALPRRAGVPGVVGPAGVVPARILLVEMLVHHVAAQVGQHAAVVPPERVEVDDGECPVVAGVGAGAVDGADEQVLGEDVDRMTSIGPPLHVGVLVLALVAELGVEHRREEVAARQRVLLGGGVAARPE